MYKNVEIDLFQWVTLIQFIQFKYKCDVYLISRL